MEPIPDDRPDPDQLLAQVKSEEARSRRGRLKIWIGASPGVGKTFAMLSQAHRLRTQGVDVVIGLVETHGRAETQLLTAGIEVLPRRTVEYRGTTLTEFDLDSALARKPTIVLVDELAHTNAPGSRYEKRWQDVRALLDAGISVHTTLNIQHVESLNDVVARSTGVTVRETVPDAMLDDADEIEVVDLPPGALLERLRAGKVYIPEAARAAAESFFRTGNLSALRELTLRKTAQLVDRRRREDRQEGGARRSRTTSERVLVCVGPSPFSARLVRAAHRMTAVVRGELFAVFVAAPDGGGLPVAARERVLQNLRLAESFGARTATIEGRDPAATIVAFAERHEVSRIVVGKTGRSRLQDALFGSFTMEVIRASRDIDVYVIHGDPEGDATAPVATAGMVGSRPRSPIAWRDHLLALATTGAAVALAWLAFDPPDLSTEVLILTLGVAATAWRCGRWASLLSALLSALAFNFLLIEPRFSFAVAEPSYLLAFAVMAVVGISLSSLVVALRDRVVAAREREDEVTALHSLTRELAEAETVEEIGRVVVAHLRDLVRADLAMFVAAPGETVGLADLVATHGQTDWIDATALAVARWSQDHGKAAGAGTNNLPGTRALFLPLSSRRGKEGVLGIQPRAEDDLLTPKQRMLLDTFAEQAAAACERVGLAEERRRARHEMETERLRSTLLASISHDLRTPLTTITGAASSLVHAPDTHSEAQRRELAAQILGQANRLNDLIANLVFATRLESGGIDLRRQWTSIEEVVGAALRRAPLLGHRVTVHVDPGLPFVDVDPVLLEQALYNLLENAARHTPAGTLVEVRAWLQDGSVLVEVADDGPGIAPRDQGSVFRRFVRGRQSAGMGLGLAISEGIVKAHGGRAWIEPGRTRGVAFRVLLPVPPTQPSVPGEPEVGTPAGDPGGTA
ncbi:MAG: sensor histidine kinase KdpD [Planctomycetes bacterium]|nr:sensor histidine kinase KdpD [Planctomycetota bacterium]